MLYFSVHYFIQFYYINVYTWFDIERIIIKYLIQKQLKYEYKFYGNTMKIKWKRKYSFVAIHY